MIPNQICERRGRAGRFISLGKMFLAVAVLFLGLGAAPTASAQSRTHRVSGQVVSNGESVIGASVLIQGTSIGTIQGTSIGTVTDVDGLFTLQTAPQDILVVSAIGYETKEVPVEGRSNLNIELAEENLLLNDAVVVGYGVQKKVNLTGAVASV